MASLQNVRRRIRSVKNIQQITKAMDMVATSRLRHAKEAAIANRPYAQKTKDVINNLISHAENLNHPLFEVREEGKFLLLVIAADKGLAGAYSSNVFKAAYAEMADTGEDDDSPVAKQTQAISDGLKDLKKHPKQHKVQKMGRYMSAAGSRNRGGAGGVHSGTSSGSGTVVEITEEDKKSIELITVGRKARDHFRHRNYNVVKYYNGISEKPKYQYAQDIARYMIERFESGEVNEVAMVYTRFVSAISFVPTVIPLLPFEPDAMSDDEEEHGIKSEYIYEPDTESVLKGLLPQYLVTVIYEAMLQSAASELSSRMNAMSNATDNAQELIKKLDLHYNKVRQAGITNEINEIVSGANALN